MFGNFLDGMFNVDGDGDFNFFNRLGKTINFFEIRKEDEEEVLKKLKQKKLIEGGTLTKTVKTVTTYDWESEDKNAKDSILLIENKITNSIEVKMDYETLILKIKQLDIQLKICVEKELFEECSRIKKTQEELQLAIKELKK